MLRESVKSFSTIVRERVSSPLSGIFVISWLIFNWKGVSFFLFENVAMSEKLSTIETVYTSHWANFFGPITLTICLLLTYPIFSVAAYFVWQHFAVAKRRIYIKVSGEVPLTLEESRALRQELEEKDDEIKRLTAFSSVKNKQLEKENAELVEVVGGKEAEIHEYRKELALMRDKVGELGAMKSENDRIKSTLDDKDAAIHKLRAEVKEMEGWLSDPEVGVKEYWRSKYFNEYAHDRKFDASFQHVYDSLVGGGGVVDDSDLKYAISNGLVVEKDGKLLLTDKAKYIADAMGEEIPF